MTLLRIHDSQGEKSVVALDETDLIEVGVLERQDLQVWLTQHINAAFGRKGSDLLLVAEEFSPWSDSNRRIDLFAVDEQANLVVIELKRDKKGGYADLQGLRYAAMASTLSFKAVAKGYSEYHGVSLEDASDTLCSHFHWDDPDPAEFGKRVRIVMASQHFDPEVTTTAIWLNEQDIDTECHTIRPFRNGPDLLLHIQRVVPVPNSDDYLVSAREKEREVKQDELPWDGYSWYVSAKPGEGIPDERNIEDMQEHGFISLAGSRHVPRLQQVRPGDIVYVKGAPTYDGQLKFIGIGRAIGPALDRRSFFDGESGNPVLNGTPLRGVYASQPDDFGPGSEHFLPIDWIWKTEYSQGQLVPGVRVGIQTICAFKGEKPTKVARAANLDKPENSL